MTEVAQAMAGGVDQSAAAELQSDMQRAGATPEQIALQMARFANPDIHVHFANWTAVMVFRLCTVPVVSTMAGLAEVGLSAVEITAAAKAWSRKLRVDASLLLKVRHLGSVYAATRNARAG